MQLRTQTKKDLCPSSDARSGHTFYNIDARERCQFCYAPKPHPPPNRSAHATREEAIGAAKLQATEDGFERAVWFVKGHGAPGVSQIVVPDRYVVGRWHKHLESAPPGGGTLIGRFQP